MSREEAADPPASEWLARVQLPARALADVACAADLVVANRTADITASQLFPSPHELLLTAGVPVLLQPPNAPPLAAKRIVIGWKNTREARRALPDALPLLLGAEEVRLVRFERDGAMAPDPSLGRVLDRLERQGVPVPLTALRLTQTPRRRGIRPHLSVQLKGRNRRRLRVKDRISAGRSSSTTTTTSTGSPHRRRASAKPLA